jgi:hypothetical protein
MPVFLSERCRPIDLFFYHTAGFVVLWVLVGCVRALWRVSVMQIAGEVQARKFNFWFSLGDQGFSAGE